MESYTGLPPVSTVLDAIESGLSEEDRTVLRDNLTQRAFGFGVYLALSRLYSESECESLRDYRLKILRRTVWLPDPLEKTQTGHVFLAFASAVHETLGRIAAQNRDQTLQSPTATTGDDNCTLSAPNIPNSTKVFDFGQALHDALAERVRRVSDTVHECQSIIAEITALLGTTRKDGRETDASQVVHLLEEVRQRILNIETSGVD
jgi:hypothetical protein